MQNILTFIDELHPMTLQYFEVEVLPRLKEIDALNKMHSEMREIRDMEALNN